MVAPFPAPVFDCLQYAKTECVCSGSIIVYCKWSKTGVGEALGTKLVGWHSCVKLWRPFHTSLPASHTLFPSSFLSQGALQYIPLCARDQRSLCRLLLSANLPDDGPRLGHVHLPDSLHHLLHLWSCPGCLPGEVKGQRSKVISHRKPWGHYGQVGSYTLKSNVMW